jgi:hypothetical protein
MKLFVAFALFIFTQIALSWDDGDILPTWEANCTNAGPIKSIKFSSKSGDVTEDDMTAYLQWDDKTSIPIPVSPAWYLKRQELSRPQQGCAGIGAFQIYKDHALLVLPFNGRPGWDRISLVLINLKTKSIVDIKDDIGETPDEYQYKISESQLELLLVKYGKLSKDGGEESVPDWLSVFIKDGKINLAWLQ